MNGVALGPLIEDLTARKIEGKRPCHLDPDLDAASLPRFAGWRPAFGQIDAAQTHLARHGVGKGDLFLFFGWFRAVAETAGRLRYVRGAPNLHVIYGWLQVGEVIRLSNGNGKTESLAPFADHPHMSGRDRPSNTLYLASDRIHLPRTIRNGGGIFTHVSRSRILTEANQSKRSNWRLPRWFHPRQGAVLSYHEQRARWALAGNECTLSSASRGQEFVIAPPNREAAVSWLGSIFSAEAV